MNDTSSLRSEQSPAAEVKRRRAILERSIGEQVKLKLAFLKPRDPLADLPGRLVDVKRVRATIDFGEGVGLWIVPLVWILLPGAVEPARGQMELFA